MSRARCTAARAPQPLRRARRGRGVGTVTWCAPVRQWTAFLPGRLVVRRDAGGVRHGAWRGEVASALRRRREWAVPAVGFRSHDAAGRRLFGGRVGAAPRRGSSAGRGGPPRGGPARGGGG